jgi:hypothetical protein
MLAKLMDDHFLFAILWMTIAFLWFCPPKEPNPWQAGMALFFMAGNLLILLMGWEKKEGTKNG